jgi:phosphatidylglycerol lysyltransferase
MKTRLFKILPPIFGFVLFTLALWVLHAELQKYHLRDIIRYAHQIPSASLLRAIFLTVACYVLMTSYDFLALRFVNRPLSFRKIFTASFIGYAFSNNIGFSMLAGASVRYRLYSSWNLSGLEITKIIFFCSISLWLGFFTLCAAVFLFEPATLLQVLHLPFTVGNSLGMLFLIPVVLYAMLLLRWKGTVNIRGMEYSVPPFKYFFPQILIATLDWAIAGTILYLLFPPVVPLPLFLGMYLAGQLAGLVSQIPGGLGIFEAIMLLFLSGYFPASSVIGALVVYRVVFYILPLACAAMLLAVEEILQRRHLFQMGTKAVQEWLSFIVPPVLTVFTFLSGAILLFSGATPAQPYRLEWMKDLLPLSVVEFSHFLGSIVGVALLILSRGIQRRIDTAYYLTIAFLGAGAALSILKGFDYEEAAILTTTLLVILPARVSFYRKGHLNEGRFTLSWIISIAIVLISTAWLTFFSYKHVEYSSNLWWHFAFMENAPRSLRTLVGATVAALSFGLLRLIHPTSPSRPVAGKEDLERAQSIARGSTETYANLALLGDKSFLFNPKGNAFIMYGTEGGSWIAMGDPVGPEEEWPELTWVFCEMCDRYGGTPVFYEVGSWNLHVYIDLGMTIVKLGEEARVSLEGFSLEGRTRKELRHTFNKLTQGGCSFELVAQENVSSLMDDLRGVSDAWLGERHVGEKGFSMGSFKEDYLSRFPVAVIRLEGKIIAFANLWTSFDKEELSVDLMRFIPGSPNGTMDFLFVNLMLWGRENGYRWFNLGLAPLSGLEDRTMSSLWNKIGSFVFRHAENFYNFKGLRAYKDKFSPQWRPRYLASMATLSLPVVLTSIASLISGGMKGIVMKGSNPAALEKES